MQRGPHKLILLYIGRGQICSHT